MSGIVQRAREGSVTREDFASMLLVLGVVALLTNSRLTGALFLGGGREYRRTGQEADKPNHYFLGCVDVVEVKGHPGQASKANDNQGEQLNGKFAGCRKVVGDCYRQIGDGFVDIKRQCFGFVGGGRGRFLEIRQRGAVVAVGDSLINRVRFGVFGHGFAVVKSSQSTGAAA